MAKKATDTETTQAPRSSWRRMLISLVSYSLWLGVVFFVSRELIVGAYLALDSMGVDFSSLNQNLLTIVVGTITYLVMLSLTIGLPRWAIKQLTTKEELGLQRPLRWIDIGIALAGMVTYFVLTVVLISIATQLLPWFDVQQAQETGITAPQRGLELALVFVLLVVVAPFIEELLFRGYLFGKLRTNGVPFWLTALVVSVLFGIAHGQWNVGVDTFALSLVMCVAREVSGAVWPAVLMHMMKNGIAYYFLFVNPQILDSLPR